MSLCYSYKYIHAHFEVKEITTKLWSGKFIFYLSDQKVFMVRIDNLSGDNWCGKFVLFNISNREMEEGKKENNEIKNNNVFQYSFDAMRFKQSVSQNKKKVERLGRVSRQKKANKIITLCFFTSIPNPLFVIVYYQFFKKLLCQKAETDRFRFFQFLIL